MHVKWLGIFIQHSKRFCKTKYISLKSDLNSKSTLIYHTVCVFCIATVEGHVKHQLCNNLRWRSNLLCKKAIMMKVSYIQRTHTHPRTHAHTHTPTHARTHTHTHTPQSYCAVNYALLNDDRLYGTCMN